MLKKYFLFSLLLAINFVVGSARITYTAQERQECKQAIHNRIGVYAHHNYFIKVYSIVDKMVDTLCNISDGNNIECFGKHHNWYWSNPTNQLFRGCYKNHCCKAEQELHINLKARLNENAVYVKWNGRTLYGDSSYEIASCCWGRSGGKYDAMTCDAFYPPNRNNKQCKYSLYTKSERGDVVYK